MFCPCDFPFCARQRQAAVPSAHRVLHRAHAITSAAFAFLLLSPRTKVVITDCGLVSAQRADAVKTEAARAALLQQAAAEAATSNSGSTSSNPHAAALEAAQRAMMRRKLTGGTMIGSKPPEKIPGTPWEKCAQPNTTNVYYYNSATGESTCVRACVRACVCAWRSCASVCIEVFGQRAAHDWFLCFCK